jgi:hypothetical protein
MDKGKDISANNHEANKLTGKHKADSLSVEAVADDLPNEREPPSLPTKHRALLDDMSSEDVLTKPSQTNFTTNTPQRVKTHRTPIKQKMVLEGRQPNWSEVGQDSELPSSPQQGFTKLVGSETFSLPCLLNWQSFLQA